LSLEIPYYLVANAMELTDARQTSPSYLCLWVRQELRRERKGPPAALLQRGVPVSRVGTDQPTDETRAGEDRDATRYPRNGQRLSGRAESKPWQAGVLVRPKGCLVMETTNLETARANAWHNMADWWLARCAELERRLIAVC